MKIGIIVDNEFDHDVRVQGQYELLKSEFEDVRVLCFNLGGSGLIQDPMIDRINWSKKRRNLWFGLQNLLNWYGFFWKIQIRRFIKKYDLDLIHVHDLYLSKSAGRAIGNSDCQMILDLHENYPATVLTQTWANSGIKGAIARPHFWKKKEEEYLSYPDKIVVLSDYFQKVLVSRYHLNPERFVVLPNVPYLNQYDQLDVGFPESKELVFCYYGAIARRRGVFFVMRQMLKNEQKCFFRLKLIGPVDGSDKEEFLALLGLLGNRCEYIPWIENSQLGRYLEDVHVCLSPIAKNDQHESGVANKVYQYMMYGRPLLVTNCTPQQKIVEQEAVGWVYEDGSESSFLKAVLEIKNINRERLMEMSARAKNAVYERYNMAVYKEKMLNLYQSLHS